MPIFLAPNFVLHVKAIFRDPEVDKPLSQAELQRIMNPKILKQQKYFGKFSKIHTTVKNNRHPSQVDTCLYNLRPVRRCHDLRMIIIANRPQIVIRLNTWLSNPSSTSVRPRARSPFEGAVPESLSLFPDNFYLPSHIPSGLLLSPNLHRNPALPEPEPLHVKNNPSAILCTMASSSLVLLNNRVSAIGAGSVPLTPAASQTPNLPTVPSQSCHRGSLNFNSTKALLSNININFGGLLISPSPSNAISSPPTFRTATTNSPSWTAQQLDRPGHPHRPSQRWITLVLSQHKPLRAPTQHTNASAARLLLTTLLQVLPLSTPHFQIFRRPSEAPANPPPILNKVQHWIAFRERGETIRK
ncbi:hypothetical protein J0S82_008754 [Galemys pyrenaicus]|uniref:Uncharacterized protein n=1 Tax=Galemys pyrenaicus TaxID=202257 RepID=A0A8J6A4P0_GALPY|nr:hypothetical protein J0S82_008754 [Galemys pyrenaicus]